MPLQKLPTASLDDVNHRRRARETINHILSFEHDDSRVRTPAEVAAGITPVNYAYAPGEVKRQGAVDTGGASDSTAAIQKAVDATVDSAVGGGQVAISGEINSAYNISDSIDITPRSSLGENQEFSYSIAGTSRAAPRVVAKTGLANKPMFAAAGVSLSQLSYYREFRNLYLNGGVIAEVGIDLKYNQHFKVENIFMNNMKKGTGAFAAGLVLDGAICGSIRDFKVHNSEGYGIIAPGGSSNFFNAMLVEGFTALFCGIDGMSFFGGTSGNCFIGLTLESCGGYGARFAGYSTGGNFFGGSYLENNTNGDVYFGDTTYQEHMVFTGNYLNGYIEELADDYSPIKVKFGNCLSIVNNQVAQPDKAPDGYYIADLNIAGGNIRNSVVAQNMVGISTNWLAESTPPNELYNLASNWVDNNNRLDDLTFAPLIRNNILRGRLPYGGWTLGTTGAATVVRIGGGLMGAPAVRMTRNSPDTCNINQTVSLTNYPEYLNRFVTFAVAVLPLVSNKTIVVTAIPDGTDPQTAAITHSTLVASRVRIIYAMCFVPADATQIQLVVDVDNDTGADFAVGQPCLYVGAQQWYDASGEPHWHATAAPTAGAWEQGDIVWKSDVAAGGSPGWVCTTAGSPGTWKAMASLAT